MRKNTLCETVVTAVMEGIFDARIALDNRAGMEMPQKTDEGKRQSFLEAEAVKVCKVVLRKLSKETGTVFYLEAEEYKGVIIGKGEPTLRVLIDPVDGTASFARMTRSKIRNPYNDSTFASVVTVAPFKEDQILFSDLLAAGIMDINSGQMWFAEKRKSGVYARESAYHCWRRITRFKRPNCNLHALRVHIDHYQPITRLAGFLIPHLVETVEIPATAMSILLAALGEGDVFMVNPIPKVDRGKAGQKTHELGAGYVFCRAFGGYAIDTRTGEDLGDTVYDFYETVPVILGAYREVVEKYFSLIQKNLAVEVSALGGKTVGEVFAALLEAIPTKRYSLPFVPELEPKTAESQKS